MNRVFLIGNLTRDPELNETSSGVTVCRFGIAVNRSYTANADGERKVDFFNVTAWRGLGETVAKFAKKGNKVCVVGSIEMRSYEDAQGVKKTSVDIVAQDVEFLSPRGSQDNGYGDMPQTGYGYGSPAPSPSEDRPRPMLTSLEDDSDVPF